MQQRGWQDGSGVGGGEAGAGQGIRKLSYGGGSGGVGGCTGSYGGEGGGSGGHGGGLGGGVGGGVGGIVFDGVINDPQPRRASNDYRRVSCGGILLPCHAPTPGGNITNVNQPHQVTRHEISSFPIACRKTKDDVMYVFVSLKSSLNL